MNVGETSVIGSYFNFMAWQFVQCFQKSSGLTNIFLGGSAHL